MKLALNIENASVAIDLEPTSRWLLEEACPIARVDMRKAGATKPLWRWRVVDLEGFLDARLTQPGQRNLSETLPLTL